MHAGSRDMGGRAHPNTTVVFHDIVFSQYHRGGTQSELPLTLAWAARDCTIAAVSDLYKWILRASDSATTDETGEEFSPH